MTLPIDPRLATRYPARRPASYGSVGDVTGAIDQNINRDLDYDASSALNRYAQGAWGSVSQGLKQTLADTRGQSVGAGRFDSGYLDEDQGVVIRQTADDFGNRLAQQSMNAEQLTQDVRGRGGEQLWGRGEQVMNDAREAAERKRRSKRGIYGAIGSVLGGAAGSFIPGLGTAAGAAIGGKIGGAF